MAPGAQAQFTLADCEGDSITGRGASFQQTAQATWANQFTLTDSFVEPAACDAFTPFAGTVSYEPLGSGAGRTAFGGGSAAGSRNPAIRFIGYDEAPTAAEQAQMEAGTSSPSDNGNLLTIPVTSGAITFAANVPNDCQVSGNATNARVEQAFRGAITTWGELFPGAIAGVNGKTTAACQATTITRAVRLDSSGTTFQFKAFLDQVVAGDLDADTAGVQTWRELPLPSEAGQTQYSNTAWPNQESNLVRGDANGAAAQADKMAAIDGSIGYLDLAIARAKGFSASNDKRWFSLQDAGGTFRAPTSGQRGSNCNSDTQYNNVPADAEADWSQVYGAIPSNGYPACALTYIGAWEDNADVYGNSPAEEAHARTVKDYLEYVLSPSGQADAVTNDYGAMPAGVQAIADSGVAQIGWNQ